MATTKGWIRAISISKRKGEPKTNVPQAELRAGLGIVGDAHADGGHRQFSLLAGEEIDKIHGDGVAVFPGDFAENITTQGLDLGRLQIGSRLRLGETAEIEVTQLGKQCHGRCAIYDRLGDCIMPRKGIFARITVSGRIKTGESIEMIMDNGD